MNLKKVFFRVTHWETWNHLVKYIPLAPVWAWYCLKARSFWFFTPSNPTLTFGGFEGETKKEMYLQLPPGTYPTSIFIDYKSPLSEVEKQLIESGIDYPFVVKPDAGMMGFMFRKIQTPLELEAYHNIMPADYLIQQLVDYPLEVSVFYYRFPGANMGTITGFIKKEFLQVQGDGSSTLEKLIEESPRASRRMDEVKSKHADKLQDVIPFGEPFILSHALNLSRGARMVSLEHEKDEKLLKLFNDISLYTRHFYYGRYDVKCASVESLRQGKDFSILEYNGCGAEPHHIYGNGNTLWQAYRIVLAHWKVLYEISALNHSKGIPYWGYRRGRQFLREAKNHFKVLKELDAATAV